jgi:hypothetical protein
VLGIAYGVLTVVNIVGFVVAYERVPEWRTNIAAENHLIENASVAMYVLCAVVALEQLVRLRRRAGWLGVLLPIVGAFGAFDEYGFGQSNTRDILIYFDLPYLRLLPGIYIDQFHGVFQFVYVFVRRFPLFSAAVVAGVAVAVAAYLATHQRVAGALWRATRESLSAQMVLVAAAFLAASLVLDVEVFVEDLHLLDTAYSSFFEELLELNGSLAPVFASLFLGVRKAVSAERSSERGAAPATA